MVDWKSLAEIQKDSVAFDRVTHAFLGVYLWEWIISLDFDWQFISRKKPFMWPMIFYFLNRYVLFLAMIGFTIALNVTAEIDCQAVWSVNQLLAGTAFACSSVNLALRTMAIWFQKWYIVYPLVILILGHFAAMLHGILLKAEWVEGQGCVLTFTDIRSFAAGHVYTMAFDFIVMSLTTIKLVYPSPGNRSKLMQFIFHDGLIYFILAFLSNLIVTIFTLLNLNPTMSIIVNGPALVITTIVACRVVRRLRNFSTSNPEMLPFVMSSYELLFSPLTLTRPSTRVSDLAFFSNTSGVRPKIPTMALNEGVDVQMETFQTPPSDQGVFPRETRSQLILNNASDCEAQVDFKRPP